MLNKARFTAACGAFDQHRHAVLPRLTKDHLLITKRLVKGLIYVYESILVKACIHIYTLLIEFTTSTVNVFKEHTQLLKLCILIGVKRMVSGAISDRVRYPSYFNWRPDFGESDKFTPLGFVSLYRNGSLLQHLGRESTNTGGQFVEDEPHVVALVAVLNNGLRLIILDGGNT